MEHAVLIQLLDFRDRWLGPDKTKNDAIARKTEQSRKFSQLGKQQYRVATTCMRNELDKMLEWMDRIDAEESASFRVKRSNTRRRDGS